MPATILAQSKPATRGTQSHGATGQSPVKKAAPTNAPYEPNASWLEDAAKNPEFMNAVNHLSERLANELQYPAMRTQSHILPRLSDSTAFYMAFPNYGQTLHQAQQIFQEELRNSPAMQDFLRKNKLDKDEPKLEDALEKLYEFSEYLGDEVVLTGSLRGKEPSGVMIAEIRKPGLKSFLENVSRELEPAAKEPLRILDPQQLQSATDKPGQAPAVLIRQDMIVVGFNTATLREFNAQLERGAGSFTNTALGKRLTQSYQAGTGMLAAADLEDLLRLVPQNPPQTRDMLEKTGFAEMKYAMMDSRLSGKNATTQMELVFNGPRRGVASWLAAPAALGSLDFMSPKSYVAEAFRLKPLTQVFDDIVELAGPNALAMLPQMEAQFNVNLKQDILSKLNGEIAFEMQARPISPGGTASAHVMEPPKFKFILGTSDGAGLQQVLKRLMAQSPMQPEEHVENGVTFYALSIPSAGGAMTEINYFFLDGYLVIASSRELAQEALQLHRSGASLAHSSQVAGQGQPVKASAMAYQNSGPFLEAIAKQLPPDTAGLFSRVFASGPASTNVMYGYADQTSIRGTATNNIASGASLGLIAAAVAIPNLLRSRMAANEAAAAASLRTINTAQVTYSTTYPDKGYAPSLAVLGPGTGDCSEANVSAVHACLLNETLGAPSCTSGKWCEKNGYRFAVRATCLQERCQNYVATATPANDTVNGKSYCSTTDAVIRWHAGTVAAPVTAGECRSWQPVR
jgi:type II secretory pathway pseudopilin PulG